MRQETEIYLDLYEKISGSSKIQASVNLRAVKHFYLCLGSDYY